MKPPHNHPRPVAHLLAALFWLAAPAPMARAEEALGRLFFTPESRQKLDLQREHNITGHVGEDPALTINGVVARSSGKRTAWVNGAAQHEHNMRGGTTVTPKRGDPAQVLVETADAPSASARVGETVTRSTGETSDLLDGGRIVVKRYVGK
ncbi:MAG: hypothetical protein HY777_03310 [Betaproteobacteria bacterium]|nr:hypothetical protein [Betaproteobacteria bacterium]